MDCSPPGSPIRGILQARILGLPCPPPGDLPDPRIEHASLTSPPLADGFFTTSTYLGSPPDQGLNRRKFRVLTPGPPGKSSNIYFKCTLLWISLSNTIYKIMGLDQSLVSSRALLYSTAGGQPSGGSCPGCGSPGPLPGSLVEKLRQEQVRPCLRSKSELAWTPMAGSCPAVTPRTRQSREKGREWGG